MRNDRPVPGHVDLVERTWAALVAYLANTAVDWRDRIHQARVFFRRRTPTGTLATAAPTELTLAAISWQRLPP